MARWGAHLISTVSAWVEVDAETPEEAEDLIYEQAPTGLCHHCAHKMSGPDDWDIDGKVEPA